MTTDRWHFCQDCGEEAGATKERDDLREQVARLEAAVHWKEKLHDAEGALQIAIRNFGRLTRENYDLQAALEKYGQHPYECPASSEGTDGSGPCTCGLDAALKGDAPGLKTDARVDNPTAE